MIYFCYMAVDCRAASGGTNMNEEADDREQLQLTLFSFGFKYGVPDAVNFLFDVRFLPNPYWVNDLRSFTGLDEQVADFVLGSREGMKFLDLLVPLLRFLIDQNGLARKRELCCAIGCTGGHHRSVAVVEALKVVLVAEKVELVVFHRDLTKE